MIRITRQADYGIVLLTQFARSNGRVFSARELAHSSQVPLPMVSKILKLLVQAEILHSTRGVRGGYQLARGPESITVGRIIVALDGPVAITDCTSSLPTTCGIESACPVSHSWQRINHAITDALERVTLAEMTCPVGNPLNAFQGSAEKAHR